MFCFVKEMFAFFGFFFFPVFGRNRNALKEEKEKEDDVTGINTENW